MIISQIGIEISAITTGLIRAVPNGVVVTARISAVTAFTIGPEIV